MRAPIANRWTPFGLERDPFFQNELSAVDDALHPASTCFVGRAAELERVATTVGSGVSSCTVVEGSGQTSLDEPMILNAVGALYRERMAKRVGGMNHHALERLLRR